MSLAGVPTPINYGAQAVNEFKALAEFAKTIGLRTFSLNGMSGEFWPSAAPVNPVIAKIEHELSKPVTEDELYDINDPDNPPVEG